MVLRNVLNVVLLMTTPILAFGQDSQRSPLPPILHGASRPIEQSRGPQPSQAEALTLADLAGMAFRHNPTLAVATARINVARGHKVQAGLYPNPVVGYHATEIGNLGTPGQQGGFVNQRFITGGKLGLDKAIAGKEIAAARFSLHAQEQRVLSDVRVRFYDAQVAQRRIELTRELVRIGDELVTATEKLIEGRQGTENDLLQAEIRADESHILLDNAQNESVEAWRRLAAVVGLPNMEMSALSGELEAELPDFDWDSCYATVLGSNPAVQAARTRVDRARIVIQRAKKEPIPDIDVYVSHRHHNVTKYNVTNIQVGVPVPLFNRNQGNIRSAEAEWVAACNEARRIELGLQDRLAVAYREYANARQQVDRYNQRMVPRAKRSLKLVTDGYEQGQVAYLTLLTAQTTYVQVNLAYLSSLRQLRAAASVIEGRLLTDSLAPRPGTSEVQIAPPAISAYDLRR